MSEEPGASMDEMDEGALFEAVDGFVNAMLAGEPVDIESWLARHPELGDALRDELELVASLHRTADSVALDATAGPARGERGDSETPSGDEAEAESGAESGRRFLRPGERLGEHVIEELLGYGGMGEVYRAHHEHLGKTVAIKVLRPFLADDAAAVSRFREEVRAQASMNAHPNVVTANHASEHDGRLFLVMEHIEGQDLSKLVRATGALPPGVAADYVRQAALGLGHAHRAGLTHRDVKPSNLLLDREGTVKVVDLGLARLAVRDEDGDGRKSYIDELVGTLDYVAPEQAADPSAADPRSDLYGLGCTLYYLLSGRAPFADKLMLKKLMAHAALSPTPIEALCPDVPAGLADVLRRLMAKDPADRFASAEELVAEIDALEIVTSRSGDTVREGRVRSADESGERSAPNAPEGDSGDGGPDARSIAVVVVAIVTMAMLALLVSRGPHDSGDDTGGTEAGRLASDGGLSAPTDIAGLSESFAEGLAVTVGHPREGVLDETAELRPKEKSPFHALRVPVEAETLYAITVRSPDFDPVAILRDENGFELFSSHDAPGLGRTAEVIVDPRETSGELEVLVTSARETGRGRYLASARIIDMPRLVPGAPLAGTLEEGDALYYEDDTYCDRFALRVTEGETYVVTVFGEGFAPAVFVETADRQRLTQSQPSDDGTSARTVFDASGDGLVHVVANTAARGATGRYTVEVETQRSGAEVLRTTGLLAEGDAQARDESYYDAFPLEVRAGHTYVVRMESEDFDTYLLLVAADGERITANDDAFGTDSRLVYTAPEDATLEVWANSYQSGETGQYQIEIRALGD